MKSLNIFSIGLLLIVSTFVSPLKSQEPCRQIATITESSEYQKQKKEGEIVYSSLQEKVPTATKNCINNSTFLENEVFSIKESDAFDIEKWTKLEVNHDGSLLLELPFDFNFFDVKTREIWINTNGNLTLNRGVGHFIPEYFPLNTPMIAPFWADLEASNQNLDAGIYLMVEYNVVRIRYHKMSLYNMDPNNTVTFEVGLKKGAGLKGENMTFTYFEISPKVIECFIKNQTVGKPLFMSGINYGDTDNHIRIQYFRSSVYSFNLAAAQDFGMMSQERYAFNALK